MLSPEGRKLLSPEGRKMLSPRERQRLSPGGRQMLSPGGRQRLSFFISFFILKLFTQGTIQSIYCFTIGPAKTIYKIKSYIIQNLQ